jgi:carbamoyl-phosphate synthase small subunit
MDNSKGKALLALEDGSVFWGVNIGYSGTVTGELVFNTSMTGYQEVITDPSYAGQVVTFTCPHIGNVGVNIEDMESRNVWVSGVVIKELSSYTSSWRASESFSQFLNRFNITVISDIDTRQITRILREKGTLKCCIMAKDIDVQRAITLAIQATTLSGADLTRVVSTKENYSWEEERCSLLKRKKNLLPRLPYHVVIYDFGVKYSILRRLADYGCRLTVLPANSKASEILALKPDGVILSNGPGDPSTCHVAIKNTRILLNYDIPILGICLGHQLLALACNG